MSKNAASAGGGGGGGGKGSSGSPMKAAAPAAPGTPVRRRMGVGDDEEVVYTPGLTSVGTLIVRIVAARKLPAATGGGFFSSGSSNPYCILEFEGYSHTTSVVAGTLDPVWPREQYFFEVKMPAMHAESDEDGYHSSVSYRTVPPSSAAADPSSPPRKGISGGGADDSGMEKPLKGGLQGGKLSGMFSSSEPHLHVMLVHKEGASSAASAASASPARPASSAATQAQAQPSSSSDPSEFVKPGKGAGTAVGVPEGDKLLGEAFVNVVDLATARAKSLDEWFPLSEGGAVRLVVEYDVIEPPPQPGEVVRLLGFGSAFDLWPLPLREEMVVERYMDANRDRLLVAYDTSEGWRCRAEVHRFHVISAGRHQTLVDEYQDKLLDAAIALWDMPLFAPVGDALDRVCEGESIGAVTHDLLGGLASLGDRWLEGGFSTMVSDVRQALVPKSAAAASTEEAGEEERGATVAVKTEKGEEEDIYQDGFEEEEAAYQFDFIPAQELQRICCPITGLPMRDPVLAADGQAYERCAIQRWLSVANTSPVTGVQLRTLELFDCRAMKETVEEFRNRNELLRRKAAAVVGRGAFSRPGSRASNNNASPARASPIPPASFSSSSEPSPAPLPPRAPAPSAVAAADNGTAAASAAEAQRTALSASPLPPAQEEGATPVASQPQSSLPPPVEAEEQQEEREGMQLQVQEEGERGQQAEEVAEEPQGEAVEGEGQEEQMKEEVAKE